MNLLEANQGGKQRRKAREHSLHFVFSRFVWLPSYPSSQSNFLSTMKVTAYSIYVPLTNREFPFAPSLPLRPRGYSMPNAIYPRLEICCFSTYLRAGPRPCCSIYPATDFITLYFMSPGAPRRRYPASQRFRVIGVWVFRGCTAEPIFTTLYVFVN